jgi:LysM repeat protein
MLKQRVRFLGRRASVLFVVLALSVALIGAMLPTHASAAALESYSDCYAYHHVQKGETLSEIGMYYGVNYHYIAKVNGIYNPDHVYAGWKLCIPYGYGYKHDDNGYGHDYGYKHDDNGYGKHDDNGYGHDYGYKHDDNGYDKGYGHDYGYKQASYGYDNGHGYGGNYYVVKKGETLSHIAIHCGVPVHYLAKMNGIYNYDHIYAGQKLRY